MFYLGTAKNNRDLEAEFSLNIINVWRCMQGTKQDLVTSIDKASNSIFRRKVVTGIQRVKLATTYY